MKREMAVKIDSEIIHALKDDGTTLCKMRPLKYQAFPGESVSCPVCSRVLDQRKKFAPRHAGRRGKSRTLQLTDKGYALVKKWESDNE